MNNLEIKEQACFARNEIVKLLVWASDEVALQMHALLMQDLEKGADNVNNHE